jgi:hypothetical protein
MKTLALSSTFLDTGNEPPKPGIFLSSEKY